ncbi:MAG: amino acid ABC transporter permease [Deltaproteobacteria bacterium]|nr:amino acid ABC transporter permease [Candidatus Anaeroferrophillacea bacterium]
MHPNDTATTAAPPAAPGTSRWQDPAKRAMIYQAAVMALAGLLGWYLLTNILTNLERQSIATGFGFLGKESAFEIGESIIPYSAADNYLRALAVGFLNTVKVAFIGIVITVLMGTVIGIARLSSNWLVAKLAGIYIEVLQGIPVLLQLFFWYAVFYEGLPAPRQSLNPLPGIFLNNRGLFFAVPAAHPAWNMAVAAIIPAAILSYFIGRWARQRRDRSGRPFPVARSSTALLVGLPLVAWWISGAPTAMDTPALHGFNFTGGASVSPEFGALLLGLVLYTAAFVAEIVRAGIQSVSHGQTEAARSLGMRPGQILVLIILPQALRVIIPPLTSQMLNLTKNSSLAVAIGFPDFVSVANTTMNQTGQAIEGVFMIMVVYLFFSLTTSAFMNWYNRRIKLVER